MKKLLLVFGFALAATMAFGQSSLVLAPLQNDGNIPDGQIRSLTRLLENALQRTKQFDIIDRSAVEDILKEHGFQLSDLSNSRKTAELGKLLNADYLVRPSVIPLAGDLFLEARIVDVNTARMLNSAEVRIKADLSDSYEKLGEFASALTGAIGGGGGSGGARPAARPSGSGASDGIAIVVVTKDSGTLYFQDKEIATLWDNETYRIPIEKPGTYTVKMVFGNGSQIVRSVAIVSRGVTTVDFSLFVVGDTGPGGGIVFYDKGNKNDGWQYLEAAPVGTEFTAEWGAYGQSVAGTGTAVGSGKRNTQLIVERLRQLGENGRAAQLCVSLSFNGYKDWFLPSKDELDLMYKNLKQKGLGGFSAGYYWSSSEGSNDGAWLQRFSAGSQVNNVKHSPFVVRAIRAF